MLRFFKKYHILAAVTALSLVTIFLGSSQDVIAQSGASIVKCGEGPTSSSACNAGDLGAIVKGVLGFVISIGLPLLFIFVAYRFVMAWFSLQQGNANAYKDAIQKAGNAIFGFVIVVIIIGGGLYTVFSVFGVNQDILKILKMFSGGGIVPHAYAQGQFLPNFVKANSLYDFILDALRLVMRFFIYPALIVIWVWTGFSFVLAQGAPDALAKAKKWLIWAVVTTLVIMVLQGFLLALRNSVNKIITHHQVIESDPACGHLS